MEEIMMSDIRSLPYPAVDACVAEYLERHVRNNPPVPLKVQWTPLSAGSSRHDVTDVAGNVMFYVIVRMQPEKHTVTTINCLSSNPATARMFPDLLRGIRALILHHQAMQQQLAERGGFPELLPGDHIPDPPPRPVSDEDWHRAFDWWDKYRPSATAKEFGEYYDYSANTVNHKRSDLGRPRHPQKAGKKKQQNTR